MRSAPRIDSLPHRWRRLACAALLAALLCACATETTAPTGTPIAGRWSLDRAASDDADAVLSKVVTTAETKLRQRLSRAGYGPPPGGGAAGAGEAPDAPDYSFDTPGDRYGGPGRLGPDFRGLKVRLRQTLLPPSQLQLAVQGDLVTISADSLPPRDYRLEERISRFDEYGTAIITTSWTHHAFVIRSNYTSSASRTDTYAVSPGTGALTLTQQVIDPTVGKIVVHSVYRRS